MYVINVMPVIMRRVGISARAISARAENQP
jgi:hypothetical protein